MNGYDYDDWGDWEGWSGGDDASDGVDADASLETTLYPWGNTSADWVAAIGPEDLGLQPGAQTEVDYSKAGTDWSAVAQASALGLSLFGPPGAVLAGLTAWGLQQESSGTAGPDTGDEGLDVDYDNLAKAVEPEKKAAEPEKKDTTPAPAAPVTPEATPSQQAEKAEQKKRRRQGFGYLEAIEGEVGPDQALLWNPNFQSSRSRIGFLA
jgi:hypothetical protein